MQGNPEELINKSLDEIDSVLDEINKGKLATDLSKAQGGEPSPDDVSDDVPADEQDDQGADEDMGADDDADVDSDSEPEEDVNDPEEDDVDKSLAGELNANENVRKALEVSDFLKSLVDGISAVIEGQKGELSKSIQSTQGAQELLAKSFAGIAKSQRVVLETQAELLKSVKAMNKRLKNLESSPVVRKSAPTAQAAQVIEKSFAGTPAPSNQLTKSQALVKLNEEYGKGNMSVVSDILALEGTGDFNALSPAGKAIIGYKN